MYVFPFCSDCYPTVQNRRKILHRTNTQFRGYIVLAHSARNKLQNRAKATYPLKQRQSKTSKLLDRSPKPNILNRNPSHAANPVQLRPRKKQNNSPASLISQKKHLPRSKPTVSRKNLETTGLINKIRVEH